MAFTIPRSRLVLQSNVSSKLGRVSLSGYVRHGRGVPMSQLRTLGSYALVYLLEGCGRIKTASLPLRHCRAGDLLFVYPEIPCSYGPGPGEIWSEFYVVFSGPVFDFWPRHGLFQPQNPVRHLPHIRRWLPQLEQTAGADLPFTADGMLRRVCRMQKFLSDIVEEPKPHAVPWLESSMDILATRPDLSPADVAQSLGLSYETFRKEFARHTGQPPARYRLQRLIEQARSLITERNLSNKQIAETLGFYDEFHFSRHFRHLTGQSTRDFRHSLQRDKTTSKSQNSG